MILQLSTKPLPTASGAEPTVSPTPPHRPLSTSPRVRVFPHRCFCLVAARRPDATQGTYLVSSTIIGLYQTQLVGNPNDRAIIRASSKFVGKDGTSGVISSDVYIDGGGGQKWYLETASFPNSQPPLPQRVAVSPRTRGLMIFDAAVQLLPPSKEPRHRHRRYQSGKRILLSLASRPGDQHRECGLHHVQCEGYDAARNM